MGDISIIARRLLDGHIQFGWCGNGGYYTSVGSLLHDYYTASEDVEYLFGLGQLWHLGLPHSENSPDCPDYQKNTPNGMPHYLVQKEQDIFRRIAFVDYAYFYDVDYKWYYINPSPLKFKLPLELVGAHLDSRGFEFDYLLQVRLEFFKYLFHSYVKEDADFILYISEQEETIEKLCDELPTEEQVEADYTSLYDYERKHAFVYRYFDPWVLVNADADRLIFTVKRKTDTHIETCFWKAGKSLLKNGTPEK